MRRLYSQRDPTPAERSSPLDFSDAYDSSFTIGRFNIQESVGAIFAKSCDTNSGADIHCRIRARGGGERQWYRGAEISFYSAPEPQTSDMNLELINQVWRPRQHRSEQVFTDGQVVWRRAPVRELGGYRLDYDPNPYIVFRQTNDAQSYLLINSNGHLHPRLTPPEHLELVKTTWTAARLPTEWYNSEEARHIISQSPKRER